MASIKIKGDTSGSTTITAPATGSDETIELSTALASKLDLAGGKILQIVRATDTSSRSTTSTTYIDVTGMAVTITPQKSDSAILIISNCFLALNNSTDNVLKGRLQLTDASNNSLSGAEGNEFGVTNLTGTGTRQFRSYVTMLARSTPATTSAVTYKMRAKSETANVTTVIPNNIVTGQMYAIEVSA